MHRSVIHGRHLALLLDAVWEGAGRGLRAGSGSLRDCPASGPRDLFMSPGARAIVGVTPLAETCVDVENELTSIFDVEAGEEPA